MSDTKAVSSINRFHRPVMFSEFFLSPSSFPSSCVRIRMHLPCTSRGITGWDTRLIPFNLQSALSTSIDTQRLRSTDGSPTSRRRSPPLSSVPSSLQVRLSLVSPCGRPRFYATDCQPPCRPPLIALVNRPRATALESPFLWWQHHWQARQTLQRCRAF